MKRVKLIKFKGEDVVIDDMVNCYQQATAHHKLPQAISNSDEYIPDYYHVEDIPIRRIVDHNVEHYIAVEDKIWEYLYLIENPVTAKSQELRIKKLSEAWQSWKNEACRTAESYKKFRETVFNASLLTRIKWVFTGVKF